MSRYKFEAALENALGEIQDQVESRNLSAGVDGFEVSYKFSQLDIGNAATSFNIPTVHGYQAELKSILVFNVTEAFNATETIDAGIEGGDGDAYLDAATLVDTALAVGASARADLDSNAAAAPAGDYTAIPATTGSLIFTATSTGTTGIADVVVTVRYYK